MSLVRQVQKAIRQAVKEATGHTAVIELGARDGTQNMLNWDDEADLEDTVPLTMLSSWREIEGAEEGLVAVDCYLYATERNGGGLIGNTYCLLNQAGRVLKAGGWEPIAAELPVFIAAARAERLKLERQQKACSEARKVACCHPWGTGPLSTDTPLPIIADWLGDHELYDLEIELRAVLLTSENPTK